MPAGACTFVVSGHGDDVDAWKLFDPPEPDPVVLAAAVGTEIDTEDGVHGLATATFDPARMYRFRLSRVWDRSSRRVNFVMLNPSTADAFKVDPTVRRCLGFAHQWGMGALEVTNVFAVRGTDPKVIRATDDPVGSGNDVALVAAACAADLVVAAWGVHAVHAHRETQVRELFASAGVTLHALRLTKDGHPGHPLYVPASTSPSVWEPQQ